MSEEKIAVHCKTEEEYDAVVYKRGRGNCGGWLTKGDDNKYEGGVCLSAIDDSWCNRDYYESRGYTIIPASEYLEETGEFKVGDRVRSDLYDNDDGTVYDVSGVDITVIRDDGTRGGGKHGYYWYEARSLIKLSTNQPKTTKKEEVKMKGQCITFESNIYEVFKDDPEMMEKVSKRFAGQYALADDRTLIALRNDKEKLITIIKEEEKEEAKKKAAEAKGK
jgi:hypothetical protein